MSGHVDIVPMDGSKDTHSRLGIYLSDELLADEALTDEAILHHAEPLFLSALRALRAQVKKEVNQHAE
jgi:hypothetical protein